MAKKLQLGLEVHGNSRSAQRAMKDLKGSISNAEHAIARSAVKIAKFGALAFGAGLAVTIKRGADEMLEAQKVHAQTGAVIKSTGGAARVSAKHVDKLAGSISNMSGIDDEAVAAGENMLLTFTNVRNGVGKNNQVFDQATRTLADMSTAMGTDMKDGAIKLGKALNDPIKGVTALTKVGVTFTDAQKEQIKALVESGDTMGAQKLMLAELNKEFGGSAKAAGQTFAGQLNILKNSFDEWAGAIVTRALPALNKLLGWIRKAVSEGGVLRPIINSLGKAFHIIKDAVVAAGQAFASAFNKQAGKSRTTSKDLAKSIGHLIEKFAELVGDALKPLATILGTVAGWLVKHKALATAVAVGIGTMYAVIKTIQIATKAWAAAQVLLNIAMTANPIGVVIVLLAGLAAGLIYAYKHVEGFRNAINAVVDFVRTHWQQMLVLLTGPIGAAVLVIVKHWDDIKKAISAAVDFVIDFVRDHWKLLASLLGGPLVAAVILIRDHWGDIKAAFTNTINSIITWVTNTWHNVTGILTGPIGAVVSNIRNHLGDIVSAVKNMPGRISSAASGMWDGIKSSFRSAVNWIIGKWNGLKFTIPAVDTHIPGVGKVGGFSLNTPNIPLLAKGGIVTQPTLAVIGEAGPEAVIPLSGPNRRGMGDTNLTIHQHFTGQPDVYSASRIATLQFQTAGLAH